MGQNSGKDGEEDKALNDLSKDMQKQFLDYYDVGERLGEGSFGVVYTCNPKGEREKEYAVKMVDKVETPADKIREEAEFLRKMNHPNIIKCHDVINEKCFVCIVMDIFKGGDLIVCMQIYWKKGKIPYGITMGIAYQMGSSLEYLHRHNLIHRDVKADNYLCDRSDIGDPDVRVILTDFGTAKKIDPGERLREKTGTKLYWSPEFYALDYSLPVDIWAMGVVVYGLISGSFPFKNKTEVASKVLKWSRSLPEDIKGFAQSMLDRNESKRITAGDLISHPVLAHAAAKAAKKLEAATSLERVESVAADPEEDHKQENFRESGANSAIKDRRAELVDRMVDTHQHAASPTSGSRVAHRRSTHIHVLSYWSADSESAEPREGSQDPLVTGRLHYWNTNFRIADKRANVVLKYEWWGRDKAGAVMAQIQHVAPCSKSLDTAKPIEEGAVRTKSASVNVVGQMLKDHDIDIDAFGTGKAKTLEQLADEVQKGSAVLMLDATDYKKLVRVVELVLVRIHRIKDGVKEYAVEVRETFADSRERETNRLPGAKKEPYENCKFAAERILKTVMNYERGVDLDFTSSMTFEKEEMSPSYPGVYTVYRSEIVEGRLREGEASSTEWRHVDPLGITKHFKWMSEEECQRGGVRYQAPPSGAQASALIEAPLGLEEEDLENYLVTHGVDISQFGQNHACSIKDFANEIQKGDSSLMQDRDGSLIRVVDVVLIKLINPDTGKVLIQTDKQFPDKDTVSLNRLPGMKRRPDENQFLTAKKILTRQLRIEENHVSIDNENVEVLEDEQASVNYPGLKTLYHKRFITVRLSKPEGLEDITGERAISPPPAVGDSGSPSALDCSSCLCGSGGTAPADKK